MAREFEQAPGGAELWKVGSKAYYLVYKVPKSKPPIYMSWAVENMEQLRAIVGPNGSTRPDKTVSWDQFKKSGALNFGGSQELVNFDSEPFEKILRDFDKEARIQPWLKDPEVFAYVTAAMLEGREVSKAELASTSYFKNKSQAELDWAVLKATDPRTARKQEGDARIQIQSMLREKGIHGNKDLVDLLAGRLAGGQWTETFVTSQIEGLRDPYLGIELDRDVINSVRGFNPEPGDRRTIQQGRDAVRQRVANIFKNRGIDPGVHADGSTIDANARINRIADQIMSGDRTFANVRSAINRQAGLHPVTETDITREGEEEVNQLLQNWLGPALAKQYEGQWVRGWAGQLRSDPDAKDKLVDELKRLRVAAFPEWDNENLRYADVAPTAKALFGQVWQEDPGETDPLFMDVLRMTGPGGAGLSAASERLRREGLKRNVDAVTQQASEGILGVGGGDVRQSMGA